MKIFVVQVETEMAVVAESQSEAEETARQHLRDEDTWSFGFFAHEINDIKLVDSELADTAPWGTDGDKTLRQLFEERVKQPVSLPLPGVDS